MYTSMLRTICFTQFSLPSHERLPPLFALIGLPSHERLPPLPLPSALRSSVYHPMNVFPPPICFVLFGLPSHECLPPPPICFAQFIP